MPISLVEKHPKSAKDFLHVENTKQTSKPTATVGNTDKHIFKEATESLSEAESKQGESKDLDKKFKDAKQTEIKFTEIKHPERQTLVPQESSHKEVVHCEIKLTDKKHVVPFESTLPPLEDPSIILLSPSSTRKSSETVTTFEVSEERSERREENASERVETEEITSEYRASETLDIRQLTKLQKQNMKTKLASQSSSISSRHEDYAELQEEVKHIKEDKAR